MMSCLPLYSKNSPLCYFAQLLIYRRFAEIIPQSICTRYGLVVGAKMAGVVRILIYTFVRGICSRLKLHADG